MNKFKKKFIDKVDQINTTKDFNQIRNKINYHKIPINETKKDHKLFLKLSFSAFSCVIVALLLVFTFTYINLPKVTTLKKDLMNMDLKLESHGNDVLVEDENIYINYSMITKGCNLNNELRFTSNSWEVYQNGEKKDKTALDLDYGTNTYDIVIYKLNEIEDDYKLEITVGK